MSKYWRVITSFILILFLLANSPVSNPSHSVRGTAVGSSQTVQYTNISTVNKALLPLLNQKTFQNAQTTPNTATFYPIDSQNTPVKNYISIAGHNIPLFTATPVNNYLPDSGSMVGVYRDRFLYGHNIASVFGNLYQLNTGDTFTINNNGIISAYQIRLIETIPKSAIDHSSSTAISTLSNIYNATYRGHYDLSIMTCAGTPYGNGDASHRLIIMASRI